LHRNGQPPGDQWGRALRPIPQRARKANPLASDRPAGPLD
jgi:hypothetical protein